MDKKTMCAVQILVEGQRVGNLDRNGGQSVVLTDVADTIARAHDGRNVTMDIIVEAVGRVNTGLDFDLKGLIDPLVLLNSEPWPYSRPLGGCDCCGQRDGTGERPQRGSRVAHTLPQ